MRVYRHFAWFRRDTGRWIGEWAGYVPAPEIPSTLLGDARLMALNAWQQQIASMIGPTVGAVDQAEAAALEAGRARPVVGEMVEPVMAACAQVCGAGLAIHNGILTREAVSDLEAWDACPPDGAVCLDVTQFGWPVGDHVWHVWDDTSRLLDWPESSVHKFIEINLDTLEVVANHSSHRPVRDAVPRQHVFDITGTPYEQFHGQIWGRFVWRGDRWGFEPSNRVHRWNWRRPIASLRRVGEQLVRPETRRALAEAPIDLDLVQHTIKEKVAV